MRQRIQLYKKKKKNKKVRQQKQKQKSDLTQKSIQKFSMEVEEEKDDNDEQRKDLNPKPNPKRHKNIYTINKTSNLEKMVFSPRQFPFLRQIARIILSEEPARPLGRWNMESCPTKTTQKIDWSNEDHCGPCGQYALEKLEKKLDERIKEIENTTKELLKKP